MSYREACIVLLAWLGSAAIVLADAPDEARAREHFAAGAKAFQAQDFSAALSAFQAAAESGLPGPAVHYNIGVSAYRLGRLDEAEAAFRIVAGYPAMASVASYNLGLVAIRRGDQDAARRWFEAARAGDDDAIRRLAAVQLEDLAPRPPPAQAAARPVVYLSTQGGYDDNVRRALSAARRVRPVGRPARRAGPAYARRMAGRARGRDRTQPDRW